MQLEAVVNAKQLKVWQSVIDRDGGMCLDCGAVASEVHHIASRARPWAWCPENMLCLCKACHDQAHTHAARVRHLRLLEERYGCEHDDRWQEWSV